MNKITIKFDTELKITKYIVVNYNFTNKKKERHAQALENQKKKKSIEKKEATLLPKKKKKATLLPREKKRGNWTKPMCT